jgi:hypothetical protein
MSNDVIFKCCICEADFRPGALDKDGKCSICRVEQPTAKNKAEAMALSQPNIHLGKKLDAEGVRQIVKEELNAFKAEQKAEQKVEQKVDNMAAARAAKQDKKSDESEGDK